MVIPFDKEFSKRSAEEFIEEVLVQKLNAKIVWWANFQVRREGQGRCRHAGR